MSRARRSILGTCLIWSTIVNAADDSPDDILARMSAAYAAAQSYSDTGEVLVHWKDQSEPNEIRFETAFARPNYFKFVWVLTIRTCRCVTSSGEAQSGRMVLSRICGNCMTSLRPSHNLRRLSNWRSLARRVSLAGPH